MTKNLFTFSTKKRKKLENLFNLSSIPSRLIFSRKQMLLPRFLGRSIRRNHRRFFVKKHLLVTLDLGLLFPIRSKGKNSRMGKGRGVIKRHNYIVSSGHKLLSFRNMSFFRTRTFV